MDSSEIIECQLRECFGRVVYSQKTHEKCADILLNRYNRIKLSQIILSSITTVGFIAVFFAEENAIIAGAIVSVILLCLNLYAKDSDLRGRARKHRHTATKLWHIREQYLSLITDLRTNQMSINHIISQRDTILTELHSVYSDAQSTNPRGYKKAQKGLQKHEEMTFSEVEIDNLLPNDLRKNPKRNIGKT